MLNLKIKKLAKKLNEYFSKDDKHMANKHMKRYSTSQVREMLIKTAVTILYSLEWLLIKKKKRKEKKQPCPATRKPKPKNITQKTSAGEDVEKLKHWSTAGGNIKQLLPKLYEGSSKNFKI